MEKLGLLFDARQFAMAFGAATGVSSPAATKGGAAAPGRSQDSAAAAPSAADKMVALLEELLVRSIELRNSYQYARQRTSVELHQLRLLFDGHYKEQLRLVDVLIDRVRMLGGTGRVFAGDFLQSTRLPCALRGRQAPSRLLRELLHAHESILSAARDGGTGDELGDSPWIRDFAVGQVVLWGPSRRELV
jgi:DNA-binding ferritin-like protein